MFEKRRERRQVDVLLRDSSCKRMPKVVRHKADCDSLFGGLRDKAVAGRTLPSEGLRRSDGPWHYPMARYSYRAE
jgi:hypothetical protein